MTDYFGKRDAPKEGATLATPDLCQFGMKEPDSEDLYWRKAIVVVAAYLEIKVIGFHCSGGHAHQRLRGFVKVGGHSVPRSALSARS